MKNFEWGVPESAMKWNIMEAKKVSFCNVCHSKILSYFKLASYLIRKRCLRTRAGFKERMIFTESKEYLPKGTEMLQG